jgi:hypothetical protein
MSASAQRRPWRAGLAVAFALSVAGGPALAVLPDGATLLNHFQNVAFKIEAKPPTPKPLTRWEGPIRARFADGNGSDYRGQIADLFRQLGRLTGLSIALADQPPYNLDIYFMTEAEIRTKFDNPRANCLGTLSGSKSSATIERAAVYISLQSEFRTRHCIVEEITQILGLTNDTQIVADSIFNDANRSTELSLPDRILVRTLYDPELKPGMTESEARPIARKIIERLLFAIDDALANPARFN